MGGQTAAPCCPEAAMIATLDNQPVVTAPGPASLDVEGAVLAAGRDWPRDPAAALLALDTLFHQGTVPQPAMDGRYRGVLVTPTLNPFLNGLFNAITSRWLPWKGKTLSAATKLGDNLF